MIINHNKFSNYCLRIFLEVLIDFTPDEEKSTISNIVDAKTLSFKSVVRKTYFDEYKVFKLSEFYKPAYGNNLRNNACMAGYNTISLLGG